MQYGSRIFKALYVGTQVDHIAIGREGVDLAKRIAFLYRNTFNTTLAGERLKLLQTHRAVCIIAMRGSAGPDQGHAVFLARAQALRPVAELVWQRFYVRCVTRYSVERGAKTGWQTQ